MSNLVSKRFVLSNAKVGKGLVIEVAMKNGKKFSYKHDEVFEVAKSKLEAMNCWKKYKTYTSSSSIPGFAKELVFDVSLPTKA